MQTAVVILNWNGLELLKEFLPNVWEHSKNDATIYLADNASTDTSVAYVQEAFPEVRIIQNADNGGYARGYNEALAKLNEELLVLLNSDLAVSKNWLIPIKNAFLENANIAAAQPKILSYKEPDYFEYAGAAGGFLDKYAYPFCRGRIFNTVEQDTGQYNTNSKIFWATGACLCIRNKDFKAIGGFDTAFFAHMEEIDLCWRLQNKGREVWYIAGSQVYHLGGGTLSNNNPQKTFYNFRNSLFCLLKNVSGFTAYKRIFWRMVLDGIAGLRFLAQAKFKHFWAILRAHASFYANLRRYSKSQVAKGQDVKYYYCKNIVYKYFVENKRRFHKL